MFTFWITSFKLFQMKCQVGLIFSHTGMSESNSDIGLYEKKSLSITNRTRTYSALNKLLLAPQKRQRWRIVATHSRSSDGSRPLNSCFPHPQWLFLLVELNRCYVRDFEQTFCGGDGTYRVISQRPGRFSGRVTRCPPPPSIRSLRAWLALCCHLAARCGPTASAWVRQTPSRYSAGFPFCASRASFPVLRLLFTSWFSPPGQKY